MNNNLQRDTAIAHIFPTTRLEANSRNGFVVHGGTRNAGLFSYVLENICNSEKKSFGNTSLIQSIYSAILDEAVLDENKKAWWRWEKKPSRRDYLYPFDWDDQFKVMDAIVAYRKHFKSVKNINLPAPADIEVKILKSLYESCSVGEDVRFNTVNQTALYMFDESDGPKIGNKEDIFVTAVVVESAIRHGFIQQCEKFASHFDSLYDRLVEIAFKGLSKNLPFHVLSRCYVSWAHYLYLLMKISDLMGCDIDSDSLVQIYSVYKKNVSPTSLEKANEKHDKYFRHLIGMSEIEMRGRFDCPLTIVYRHRRLSHYYGSFLWDCVLDNDI